MELRLESFVQDTIKRKLDLYHVVVRQHGEIIGIFDWRENRREDIHSVSKSFLSIAIGIAIDEGILRLDEKPAEIFSDKLPESPSENLQVLWSSIFVTLVAKKYHESVTLPSGLRMVYDNH